MDYYGRLSGVNGPEVRKRRDELLDLVGLRNRDRESVRQFSKGMGQRLGLAQALLHDPEILFLDEPTDGLDPVGRNQMRQIIEQLRDEGRTIFLNSHILQEVQLVCDRVAILHHGSLRFLGSLDDVPALPKEDVEFQLAGDEATVRQVLTDRQSYKLAAQDRDRLILHFAVSNQSEIDQTVDQLREANVSILAIQRKRFTLEELFLHYVAAEAEVL